MKLRLTATLALLAVVWTGTPLRATDTLYVTMYTGSIGRIVSYDISLSTGAAIQASESLVVNTNLGNTNGLGVDSSGDIYAVNLVANAGTVEKFNSSGVHLGTISSNLNGSLGLALDSSNNLYVGNAGSGINSTGTTGNTVSTFTPLGVFDKSFGSGTQINGLINGARGITVDSSGNTYVTNYFNTNSPSVAKYDTSGNGSTFVAASGTNLNAYDIKFDGNGNYYVSYFNSDKAIKYAQNGSVLHEIATPNSGTATGLFVDSSNNVYLASYGDKSISKFDENGTLLLSWKTNSVNINYQPRFMALGQTVPVPEPSTWILCGISAGTLVYAARRRKSLKV